jgi:lactoylglutathione lyase
MGMQLLRKREVPEASTRWPSSATATRASMRRRADLQLGPGKPYDLGSGFGHLAVGVPDVYGMCEQVTKAGGKVTAPGRTGEVRHHGDRLRRGSRRLQDRADRAEVG